MLRGDAELQAGGLDLEGEDPQTAGARLFGIELAECAGRRVARVGVGRLARFLALLIGLRELALRQVDLAAHLHLLGPALAAQPQRQVEHGPQVCRDVLPFDAVAARDAGDEDAVLVGEAHRGAVDLHLERVPRRLDLRDQPGVTLLPFLQLRFGERVCQRQHRNEMTVLAECARRLAADAERRGVRSLELGVLRFEVLELAEQPVVLGVRQLRLVEEVVPVIRPFQNPPQLSGACCRLHRPLASSWMTAMATLTRRSSSSALALGRRPSPQAPSPWPKLSRRRRMNERRATRSSSMRRSWSPVSCVRWASRSYRWALRRLCAVRAATTCTKRTSASEKVGPSR